MNGVAPTVRAVYMHGNNAGTTLVHGPVNGTVTPGTRTPGTRTPGNRTPGTRTPGTRTPGTLTPGRCTPITLVNKKYHDIMAASNASTVAIDNKIEQAMDLVKSHLMFAVREEVEVLKEKIGELMDRISQLEYENTVLRQCATQDALQQISQQHPSSNT